MGSFSAFTYRCIACAAAILFIGVSASQNISHGYALGASRSETSALILAAGSLAGALMMPCAFLAATTSLRSLQLGKGLVALALGVACFTYATTSSLGFVASSRDTAAATRGADADAYAIAKAKAGAATVELETMGVARPAGELQAEIAALKHDRLYDRSKRCTDATAADSRELCVEIERLEAEKARGDRRRELQFVIAAAEKVMGARHGAGIADPQASALATYGAALGLALEPGKLSPWLTLLAVVFFELGAAGSLIVVAALPTVAKAEKNAKPATFDVAADPIDATAKPPVAIQASKRGRKRSAPLQKIVDRLNAAGGKLEGSLDEIGSQLGLSKSSAHRALQALAGAGTITLASSGAGTLVRVR